MNAVYGVAAAALVTALLALTLRGYRPEFALLVSLGGSVLLLLAALPYFADIVEFLRTASVYIGEAGDALRILFKTLGVAVVTQLAADLCRDAGESAMAGKVELCGKAAVLALSLPLASDLLRLAAGLLR